MTIQRTIEQFRPLVESGYASTKRFRHIKDTSTATSNCVSVITDHHVTLRIDVAALSRHLVDKIVAGRGCQSVMAGGAIRMKINTSKERT